MKVYCFRILNSDNEKFLRDVAILEDQSFLELHEFIVEICGFRDNELASFYLCDDAWYKETEISLMDMSIDESDLEKFKTDDEYMAVPVSTMSNTNIGDVVKNVGRKILYEYDFMSPITLFVECISIDETDDDDYPACVKSFGDLEEVIEVQRAKKNEIDLDDLCNQDLLSDIDLDDVYEDDDIDYYIDDGFNDYDGKSY